VGKLSIDKKTAANEYRLKQVLPPTKPNYLFQEGYNIPRPRKNKLPKYAGFDRNSKE
jgi:hypothetical protein